MKECSSDMFTWSENNGMKATQKNATFLLVRRTVICDKLKIEVNVVKFERSLDQELLLKSYM